MLKTIITPFGMAIVVLFLCYTLVFLAIVGDLWSGIRKAKKAGVARMSCGYRRTVEKVAKYYNCLFNVSVIDGFAMISVYMMHTQNIALGVPIFPAITVCAGAYIAFIEVRSVFEKIEDKERARVGTDMEHLIELLDNEKINKLMKLLKTRTDVLNHE